MAATIPEDILVSLARPGIVIVGETELTSIELIIPIILRGVCLKLD